MFIEIKKAGTTIEIDFDSLPQASRDYIIAYGLKQSLNDSIAGAKTPNEIDAFLNKRTDALRAGTVGIRSSIPTLNPLEAIAFSIAKAAIKKAFKGKTFDDAELDKKAKAFASDPRIIAAAEKRLEAKKLEQSLSFALAE